MQSINRILCVLDPHVEAQPAFERTRVLANALGADVELLVTVKEPAYNSSIDALAIALSQYKNDLRVAIGKSLDDRVDLLGDDGIRATATFSWHYSLHESVIEHAERTLADLIIKDTHYHSALQRTFYTDTDRHLLRTSTIPLWLVRADTVFGASARIVACVDPQTDDGQAPGLADYVLATSVELASDCNASAHALYVQQPLAEIGALAEWAVGPTPIAAQELTDTLVATGKDQLQVFCRHHGLDAERSHFLTGRIDDVLPGKLTELDAALAILGVATHKGLRKKLIGATAERILDHAPCDLLLLPS